MDLIDMGKRAKEAAALLALTGTDKRKEALSAMADALMDQCEVIISINMRDVRSARAEGAAEGFLDRLTLNEARVAAMADGLRVVAELPDPLAKEETPWQRPNGMIIQRVRIPMGVIGIIFESRPNVTADAAGLCVFAGSACMLRGGSEATQTNGAIVEALRSALVKVGLPADCVQLLGDPSRDKAREMMRLNGLIDVLIPRGGAGLIKAVVENATVPVIETGAGVCHTYIDKGMTDFAMGQAIALNAKISRPSVCNSMETLLVDEAVAQAFLPACMEQMRDHGVEIRGCEATRRIVPWANAATEEDWDTEYNDMILSVKVVRGMDEAVAHINAHNTRNSECIVTQDQGRADEFLRRVDSSVVYHNVSTRYTDGGEFGFGAEIGISNQRLHAQGPMGPEQIISYKYIVRGTGQIR